MPSQKHCQKCDAPIPRGSKSCPQCSPPPARKKVEAVPVLLIVAVLCSSLLMLSSSVVNLTTIPVDKTEKPSEEQPSVDLNLSAYNAARQFVEERFPGKMRFSELYQSSIDRKGNLFTVTLSADDLGAATPVRHFYSVEMESSGASWILKEIHR